MPKQPECSCFPDEVWFGLRPQLACVAVLLERGTGGICRQQRIPGNCCETVVISELTRRGFDMLQRLVHRT